MRYSPFFAAGPTFKLLSAVLFLNANSQITIKFAGEVSHLILSYLGEVK